LPNFPLSLGRTLLTVVAILHHLAIIFGQCSGNQSNNLLAFIGGAIIQPLQRRWGLPKANETQEN
jgi:hypothetical protein